MRIFTLILPLLFIAACDDTSDPSDTDPDTETETETETEADTFNFATDAPSSYDRVDRAGMPAINTAVITSKDEYNDADPTDDANGDFVSEIVANVTGLHDALDDDLVGLGITPCDVDTCIAQAAPLVVPDVLTIDIDGAAAFPNGRNFADPVIDITFAVVLLDLGVHGADLLASVPLNPPANDKAFSSSFPYLAPPN